MRLEICGPPDGASAVIEVTSVVKCTAIVVYGAIFAGRSAQEPRNRRGLRWAPNRGDGSEQEGLVRIWEVRRILHSREPEECRDLGALAGARIRIYDFVNGNPRTTREGYGADGVERYGSRSGRGRSHSKVAAGSIRVSVENADQQQRAASGNVLATGSIRSELARGCRLESGRTDDDVREQ